MYTDINILHKREYYYSSTATKYEMSEHEREKQEKRQARETLTERECEEVGAVRATWCNKKNEKKRKNESS